MVGGVYVCVPVDEVEIATPVVVDINVTPPATVVVATLDVLEYHLTVIVFAEPEALQVLYTYEMAVPDAPWHSEILDVIELLLDTLYRVVAETCMARTDKTINKKIFFILTQFNS